MSTSQIVIESQNLFKEFSGIIAVNEVSLNVSKGEIFSLVGPDGAGKSTFIRLLCTILAPDSGSARVLGFDIRKEPEDIRRLVGYMPQKFSLYEDLTVEENLNFYAHIFSIPLEEAQKREDEVLKFSRLAPFRKKRAGTLSGGMKQKLALSCALMHSPSILFLDEPTTGVDPISRREFWQLLFDLKAKGTTIFLATPYLEEAERSNRVAFMHTGRIIACNTPEKLKTSFKEKIIRLKSDHLLEAKEALLKVWPDLKIINYGSELRIISEDVSERKRKISKILMENAIPLAELEITDPDLNDVFIQILQEKNHGNNRNPELN